MEGKIITLDVGGTIFKISTLYLTKCEFFRNMLEDIPYTGEAIYIDRSPHIFKHVLSYLRDSSYPYPEKYINELDYFLINAADVNKYDPMKDTDRRLA